MEKKQRFFIYDRKEVGVLLLLGVMVAVFAFTLGVHLGKRVIGKGVASHGTSAELKPVAEASNHSETEQAMAQPTAVPPEMVASSEEAANQATHEEVTRTGVKLDQSRQLELPEKTVSKNAGATSHAAAEPQTVAQGEVRLEGEASGGEEPVKKAALQEHAQAHSKRSKKSSSEKTLAHKMATAEHPATEPVTEQEKNLAELDALNQKAASRMAAATGRFTLQIGSYADLKEAEARVKDLEISGLIARVHETDLKAKGHWYRIYVGGFPTKVAAEKAGEKYRSQGMIQSFIVAKSVE